jgi:CBS domain containing-hemolysin-like protein
MTAFWIVLIIACVLFSGYFSGVETGYYRLNRVRLRYYLEENLPAAVRLHEIIRHPQDFLIFTLTAQNLFNFSATFVCTKLFEPAWHHQAEFIATLVLSLPLFIFGEMVPKEVYRRASDVLMYRGTRVLWWASKLAYPAVAVLKRVLWLATLFARKGAPPGDVLLERQRLRHYFTASAEEGVLTDYQSTMARNIMKLRETRVDRVMVPADQVITVKIDATLEDCRILGLVTHFRRLPAVDRDGKMPGVVNFIDVLAHPGGPFDLRQYLRKPQLLPRSTPVTEALNLLKRAGQPMGFVTDDAGNIIGILTVKDLVEEIVGDLGAW